MNSVLTTYRTYRTCGYPIFKAMQLALRHRRYTKRGK